MRTATRFGCCITVLVEEMLSSKVSLTVSSLNSWTASPGELERSLASVTR